MLTCCWPLGDDAAWQAACVVDGGWPLWWGHTPSGERALGRVDAVLAGVHWHGSAFIPVRWRLPAPERVHLHSVRRTGTPPGLPWGRPPGRLNPARRAGAPAEQAGPGCGGPRPSHAGGIGAGIEPDVSVVRNQRGGRGWRARSGTVAVVGPGCGGVRLWWGHALSGERALGRVSVPRGR